MKNKDLKSRSMNSKLSPLTTKMTFLNKLLKDNSEVEKLKKVYSNMVNVFNACKDQNNFDKGLRQYSEKLISEGMAISEEDLNILSEEDLITLDNRLSSKYDFNDTFKLSRTNTNIGSLIGKRETEFEEITMAKSKSNNFELTDIRRGKGAKASPKSEKLEENSKNLSKIDERSEENTAKQANGAQRKTEIKIEDIPEGSQMSIYCEGESDGGLEECEKEDLLQFCKCVTEVMEEMMQS